MKEKVKIIQGIYTTIVYFYDTLSVKANVTGTSYKNPSQASWHRLMRVMNDPELISLELVSESPYDMEIVGWRVNRSISYGGNNKTYVMEVNA
jgi:hypothetical protein